VVWEIAASLPTKPLQVVISTVFSGGCGPDIMIPHAFSKDPGMKKCRTTISVCVVGLLVARGFSAPATESGNKKKIVATCPVTGRPAIEKSFIELPEGNGKVYFCCENCPRAYVANPKKYRIQLHRQLVETGQEVQVACPICGKPGNANVAIESGAARVSFCGAKCLAKYNEAKTDAAKLKLVFNSAAMRKSFTHQIKCPVSGKPIDPTCFVEYEGEKVYFCCANCSKAFKASPEQYVPMLYQFTHKDETAKKK
jgi:YHS domain-containing protein